jgi:hypothetical protein
MNKSHNDENLSWVQVPVVVSAAWKLGEIDEQRQGQSCLFRQGNYRNKGYNPEELSCVRVPMKISLVQN